MLKAEPVHGDGFSDLRDLQARPSDYVHRHDNFRIHSTLGYMSPVEFMNCAPKLGRDKS